MVKASRYILIEICVTCKVVEISESACKMSDYIKSSDQDSFINDGSISESSWSPPECNERKKKVLFFTCFSLREIYLYNVMKHRKLPIFSEKHAYNWVICIRRWIFFFWNDRAHVWRKWRLAIQLEVCRKFEKRWKKGTFLHSIRNVICFFFKS